MKYIFLLAVIFSILMVGCNRKANQDDVEKTVRSLYDQKIQLPDSTYKAHEGSYIRVTNSTKSNTHLHLFSYINGDCGPCFEHLQEFDSLLTVFDSLAKIQPQIYVYTSDEMKFLYNLKRTGGVSYPVYLDLEHQITQLNALPSGQTYRTLLLDSTGRVLAVGNPLHNPELEKLYKAQIRKHAESAKK